MFLTTRYSPSIRALRAPGIPCLTIRIPIVDLGRLVSRLDLITKTEGLSLDKITLTQLVEMSDRDIRSCLNTLQVSKNFLWNYFCIHYYFTLSRDSYLFMDFYLDKKTHSHIDYREFF